MPKVCQSSTAFLYPEFSSIGGGPLLNGTIKTGICLWSLPIEGPYVCELAFDLGFEGIQLELGTYERGFPL